MKYIRTKDGIYEIDKLIYAFNDNEEYLIKDIVKQADTIEELCDEFVILWENNIRTPYKYTNLEWTEWAKHRLLKVRGNCSVDKVYGAIWTDKGLIYVAKLNDKGELELL